MTSLSGVTWDQVHRGRKKGNYGEHEVFFIGPEEFKANKRASGRKKDEADLEALGEI